MKISLVIFEDTKQIMMTPETDHEKEALKWISATDNVEIAKKWGTYDDAPQHFKMQTGVSQGGYLRRYAEKESLMFIITSKAV